jgi:hypothetical protein
MSDLELDPRWEWVDVSSMGEGPGTTFVRAYCNHLEVEPVTDVDGELVAKLCRTCDKHWPTGKTLDQ